MTTALLCSCTQPAQRGSRQKQASSDRGVSPIKKFIGYYWVMDVPLFLKFVIIFLKKKRALNFSPPNHSEPQRTPGPTPPPVTGFVPIQTGRVGVSSGWAINVSICPQVGPSLSYECWPFEHVVSSFPRLLRNHFPPSHWAHPAGQQIRSQFTKKISAKEAKLNNEIFKT